MLYEENDEFDQAVKCMIDHPETAWDHERMLDCVLKVRNPEYYYRCVEFYLDFSPLELGRLLTVISPKVDHTRVVHLMRKNDNLPLVLPYLNTIQLTENIAAVNEAYNEVKIDDEDFASLRQSIDDRDNFDQLSLASKLKTHELLEFRRISAYLYRKNARYAEAIELSKKDRMYKDAIDCCEASKDEELVLSLLKFFVNVDDKECFAACLYTCYELVSPDVVMELAWRNGLVDFAMPFMIQYMCNTHVKVKELDARLKEKEQAQQEEEQAQESVFMTDGLGNPYMLTNQGFNPQQQQQQQFQTPSHLNPQAMMQDKMTSPQGYQQQQQF